MGVFPAWWSSPKGLSTRWLGISCRPMMNKSPTFKGLNIRIPIIPIKGRGLIKRESGLGFMAEGFGMRLRV